MSKSVIGDIASVGVTLGGAIYEIWKQRKVIKPMSGEARSQKIDEIIRKRREDATEERKAANRAAKAKRKA